MLKHSAGRRWSLGGSSGWSVWKAHDHNCWVLLQAYCSGGSSTNCVWLSLEGGQKRMVYGSIIHILVHANRLEKLFSQLLFSDCWQNTNEFGSFHPCLQGPSNWRSHHWQTSGQRLDSKSRGKKKNVILRWSGLVPHRIQCPPNCSHFHILLLFT
jgi:hypothetical protein